MQADAHHSAGEELRSPPAASPENRKRLRRLLTRELAAPQSEARFALSFVEAAEVLGGTLNLEVDPASITQQFRSVVSAGGKSYRIADFFVGSGDWTAFLRPVRKFEVHREVRDLLQKGTDFKATLSYRRMIERMEAGNPDSRPDVLLDSLEKIDHYFENSLRLIDSIKLHGVRRRRLNHVGDLSEIETGPSRPLLSEIVERDIGLAVGADGRLYRLCSGQHRFAVAQLLRLKSVPAEIRMIHLDWLGRVTSETGLNPLAAVPAVVKRAAQAHKTASPST